VRAALRRSGASCLVSAIVLQAWEAAHGRRRDLIVGVAWGEGFHAHAWLEGDRPPPASHALEADISRAELGAELRETVPAGAGQDGEPEFHELLRRPAPSHD
jgi:transglutaminase superfamily protein